MGNSNTNIYVQTISAPVMTIYEKLPKMENETKDTRLSILKSSNVGPRALIRSLENFIKDCKSTQLKQDIQNVIFSIEDMNNGGETRLFICHNKENIETQLEFVCAAVRMYKNSEGTNACDFCLATYSYAKQVDTGKAVIGIGTIGTAVAFGVIALATGGVGGVVMGCVSGAMSLAGFKVTATAFDTSITGDLKNFLEASFLYELVNRGHAVIGRDKRLYIT